jgi:hypothetical protein
MAANLYINDRTAASQILAYMSVVDADAGENGTVKSIELSLVNFKQPSALVVRERAHKLEQVREYERLANVTTTSSVVAREFNDLAISTMSPQMPVRLNKIANKLYTLQLAHKLNFKRCESYSIDIHIKDNGTRPQLETKSRINLNVLDNNQYAPLFLNLNNRVHVLENLTAVSEQPIFRAHAVDLDDERNGQLRFKIINNPFVGLVNNREQQQQQQQQLSERDFKIEALSLLESTFSLDRESGELRLLRPLPRHRHELLLLNDTIELHIMAQDQAEPHTARKHAIFKLLVHLVDLNNNRPVFRLPSTVAIEKNQLSLVVELEDKEEQQDDSSAFTKVTGDFFLTDYDTYETNGQQLLVNLANKTSELLKSIGGERGPSSPLLLPLSSLLDSKVFKFGSGDTHCYKAFNIELSSSSSSSSSSSYSSAAAVTQSDTLPFLVHIDRAESPHALLTSSSNYANCRVSVWLDNGKARRTLNVTSGSNYKLKLWARDNGKTESSLWSSSWSSWSQSEVEFSIDVMNSRHKKQNTILLHIDLSNKTDLILDNIDLSLNPTTTSSEDETVAELEMCAAHLLTRNNEDSSSTKSFELVNVTGKFRLVGDSTLQYQVERVPEGVYLIEFYRVLHGGTTGLRELTRLRAIFHKTSLTLKYLSSLLGDYESKVNKELRNQHNVFMFHHTATLNNKANGDMANGNGLMKTLQNSFSQFQSLLFGGGGSNTKNDLLSNNEQQQQQLIYSSNGGGSSPTTVFSLLFNNRSTFIKFIVVTMLLSFLILMLLACCILLIIRRNCIQRRKNKSEEHKQRASLVMQHQQQTATINKKLNVHDDSTVVGGNNDDQTMMTGAKKVKVMFDEDESGGFVARLIAQQEQKSGSSHSGVLTIDNDKYDAQNVLTNEKVTRYLNCLDTAEQQQAFGNSGQHRHNHVQQQEHAMMMMMMLNEESFPPVVASTTTTTTTTSVNQKSRTITCESSASSEPNTSSPSSSSSVAGMDSSKKNLIMPVHHIDFVDSSSNGGKVTASYSATDKSGGGGRTRPVQSGGGGGKNGQMPKSSVCTLSTTTSSSCISDEGCYGSSDFSSEHERQMKQQQQLQQQQQHHLNPNNIMKNQLIVSRTQTPILNYVAANNANLNKNYYHSYCLSNLSRFEKIYNSNNNNNNSSTVSRNDSALAATTNTNSSSSSPSTSPASSNSNVSNPPHQIVTAISGSYV